jgi:hypothetical protein
MITLTRFFLSLLTSGLFLSLSTPAIAARSYLIELVVFTNQSTADTESWSSVQPPLNARKMSRASRPGVGELEMKEQRKEVEDSKFPYYIKQISNNPKRKVLLSKRWVQPVLGPASTSIARITDARISDDFAKSNTTVKNGLNNQIAPELPQLDGFINFYLNNQYTLEADIRYTPPYRPSILDEKSDMGPVSYRIHEKRRIKSGELNYYDHPAFGIVLLVTPVETPQEG